MSLFDFITSAIKKQFPELVSQDFIWSLPPQPDLGDIAFRMFEPAKLLGIPPNVLSNIIAEQVRFGEEVVAVLPTGPYLNFRLNRSLVAKRIVEAIFQEPQKYGSNHSGKGHSALVEHTSINPNASPHVGRARNAMIGDSIVRLLRFEGFDTEVHYYVNDMGRQIGLLVLGVEERLGNLDSVTTKDLDFDEILSIYVEANARAEKDPDFASKGYELLARMEQGDVDVQRRFRMVTDLCLKGQLAVLQRLGVQYDVFDRESEYISDPRLDEIVNKLDEVGAVFVDEEERLVVDLSKIGHNQEEGRYFVLRRANGSSMYGYRDLAYTIHKMSLGKDINIIVLGEDHKMYAQQQATILKAAGYSAPEAIYYSYIILKDGKMSTRQGKVVLLSDFIDEAVRRAMEKVTAECTELSHEQQQAVALKVAIAAVRFAILRVNPNKNVVFDWESSLSFTGDTGPYIQYSCARISAILRKFGPYPQAVIDDFSITTYTEWALCLKLATFPTVVENALFQRSPAPLAQYALETARLFTTFYHECPVLDAPSPSLRTSRAQLCAAVRTVISNALGLLGIEAVERM